MSETETRLANTPSTPVQSRQQIHDAIAAAASKFSGSTSLLENGVSLHTLPSSVSFTQVKTMLSAAKEYDDRAFVGTKNGKLVFSVNFSYESPKQVESEQKKVKKRVRDPHEEAVQAAVHRVKRGVSEEDLNVSMIENAKSALDAMLTQLRGARNETAIESWGLSFKKEETSKMLRPRLILSFRMTPAVAISAKKLFKFLGAGCRTDGMLSTQNSSSIDHGFNLPLSEQATESEKHGQKAFNLFATVD